MVFLARSLVGKIFNTTMLSQFKRVIKQIPWLYQSLIFAHQLFLALLAIRLDYHVVREFFYEHRGSVSLGQANYRLYSHALPSLLKIFADQKLVILDVGANDGWFAKVVFRFCGPTVQMISFEPLISACAQLAQLKSGHPNYHFENLALGATEDHLTINEYSTSGLSSIKGFSQDYQYSDQYYDTTVVNRYPVPVSSLDNYLAKHQLKDALILKIDTQGFEYEVLLGARQALASGQIKVVIIEVMTIEKYQESKLYPDIFNLLHAHGFRLFDLSQSCYEADGSMSEFDCVFVKK
jgi:FkbM family methyltransferase